MRPLLKLIGVLLLSNLICIGLFAAALFVLFVTSRDNVTVSPDELGQLIHSPIPADATDIKVDPNTVNGYTIQFSFSAPPLSANQFTAKLCQGKLYKGYDPFSARNYYTGYRDDALIKASGYAYFSSTDALSEFIYGNRCSMDVGTGQFRIDKTNPQKYSVRFEVLSYTCDVDVMCDAPYGFDNNTYRPLPKNAPLPLTIFGFGNTKSVHSLRGNTLCAETMPDSFSSWDRAPFNFNEFKGASFELFVDDVSKGQAIISGRLKVDYSTGKFVGLHESPEYCFQVDSPSGTHQMSIEVKTLAGKEYQYAWDFRVE